MPKHHRDDNVDADLSEIDSKRDRASELAMGITFASDTNPPLPRTKVSIQQVSYGFDPAIVHAVIGWCMGILIIAAETFTLRWYPGSINDVIQQTFSNIGNTIVGMESIVFDSYRMPLFCVNWRWENICAIENGSLIYVIDTINNRIINHCNVDHLIYNEMSAVMTHMLLYDNYIIIAVEHYGIVIHNMHTGFTRNIKCNSVSSMAFTGVNDHVRIMVNKKPYKFTVLETCETASTVPIIPDVHYQNNFIYGHSADTKESAAQYYTSLCNNDPNVPLDYFNNMLLADVEAIAVPVRLSNQYDNVVIMYTYSMIYIHHLELKITRMMGLKDILKAVIFQGHLFVLQASMDLHIINLHDGHIIAQPTFPITGLSHRQVPVDSTNIQQVGDAIIIHSYAEGLAVIRIQ